MWATVDGRVVKRPRGDSKFFKTLTLRFSGEKLVKLETGQTLRWKGKTAGRKGWGVLRGKLTTPRL
jgi:hypothetical protein